MMNWDPLFITLKLAVVTTVILLVISIPLAYWLVNTKSRSKPLIETLISMPLVLPPTVLGFYFLVAFSPGNAFGNWINEWLGLKLVFSFGGLVLASIIYSQFSINTADFPGCLLGDYLIEDDIRNRHMWRDTESGYFPFTC